MECTLVYFSPTDSTRTIVTDMAAQIFSGVKTFDLTVPAQRTDLQSAVVSDALMIGIPVYSGRVPPVVCQAIGSLRGNNTPAVLVVVYGNRDYDDALVELRDIIEANGFKCVAAAAVVAEHSVVRSIGTGRPDEQDKAAIAEFSAAVKEKLGGWSAATHSPVYIKGNTSYRPYQSLPIHPRASGKCVRCGICAKNCPAAAIPPETPHKTSAAACITCMRCVRVCPHKARNLTCIERFVAFMSLKKKCRVRKEPELFIGEHSR